MLAFAFKFVVSGSGLFEEAEQLVDAVVTLAQQHFQTFAIEAFQSQFGVYFEQAHLQVVFFSLEAGFHGMSHASSCGVGRNH